MVSIMLTELVNVLVALLPTLLPPLLEGAIAVSYTHLDVYKRQVLRYVKRDTMR